MTPTELPSFEATWWPIELDTVAGGSERIVIGTVVRAGSGQSQVRQIISPPMLNAMFATAGKGMQLIVGTTVIQLQEQLNQGVAVENLQYPFGGVRTGVGRDCVANDLNEVFEVAIRLSTAFGVSNFGIRESVPNETKIAFDDWANRVRTQVLMNERVLASREYFNIRVRLTSRKQSSIGFLHERYVANFGVLRPGHSSQDTRALKLKIFDLEVFRRMQPDADEAEVIVGCPTIPAGSPYPLKEIEALEDSWQFIVNESKARDISPVRCEGAVTAANHLLKRIAA